MSGKKPTVFVSPCGTSVLTNESDNKRRGLINRLANHGERELTQEEKHSLDQHIRERRQVLEETGDTDQIKGLSAELNGLLTYHGGIPEHKDGTPDQHILVVSDTYLGHKVGKIIESWLRSKKLDVRVWAPPGLVTSDRESFRDAMTQLIRWCEEELKGYSDCGYHVAFNLTGGFKSVQGFLQTLGMFYADESFYIFQSGSLLTIPRLPITLDVSETVEEHLDTFRQFELGLDLPSHHCTGIPDTLLIEHDGRAALSEWGELVWQRSKDQFYGKQLFRPLDRIEYGPQFAKRVEKEGLTPQQLATLNKRLDQLSLVAHGKGTNLKGLDFKPLKGNPKPPSTHECDIWSGDERRLFGHYETGVFVIDAIDRGLH